MPETGGDVTFTFVVKNTSTEEPVTITSLSDSVYGTLAGDADCEVGTVLAAGAACEFSFTQWVEGDFSGPEHINVFTAKAVDNDNTEPRTTTMPRWTSPTSCPTIDVTKTADPTSVPETGGNVIFTFVVKNTSTEEPVTITSLIDSVYGTLAGDADCEVGTVLAAGASCEFSFTQWVEGDYSARTTSTCSPPRPSTTTTPRPRTRRCHGGLHQRPARPSRSPRPPTRPPCPRPAAM